MEAPGGDGRSSNVAKEKPRSIFSTPKERNFFCLQLILRIAAILLTVVSISVMVRNKQSVTIFILKFEARYTYSSAFKFLVGAQGAVCAFSALSLVLLLTQKGSLSTRNYFLLFLHDMVMTVLMISGCAAATAVGYVGKHGEEHMGWQAVCNYVGTFCNRNVVSVALSYLAFIVYLALTIITAYKLMSPPKQ